MLGNRVEKLTLMLYLALKVTFEENYFKMQIFFFLRHKIKTAKLNPLIVDLRIRHGLIKSEKNQKRLPCHPNRHFNAYNK